MPGRTTAYSFKSVAVIVDGRPVEGFWEGDNAVEIERRTDNATAIVGVDGDATVSISADDSVTVTLRLQPNSPANTVLQNKFTQMRSGRLAAFPISIRDTGNGEGGSAPTAVILGQANSSLGASATAREWTIFCNPWNSNPIQYA